MSKTFCSLPKDDGECDRNTASFLQTMETLLERGNGEYFRGKFDDALFSFNNITQICEATTEERGPSLDYNVMFHRSITYGALFGLLKCKVASGDVNSLNELKEITVFQSALRQADNLTQLFLDAIKHSAMPNSQKKVILTWLQQSGFCNDVTMNDVERLDLSMFYTIGSTGEDLWRPVDELTSAGVSAAVGKSIVDEVALKTSPGEVLGMYEVLERDCIKLINEGNHVDALEAFKKAEVVLDAAARKGLQLEALRPTLSKEERFLSVLCSIANGDTRLLDRIFRVACPMIPLDMGNISDILKRSWIPVDRKRFCLRLLSHYGYHLDNSEILEIIGTMSGLKIANALYADGRYTEAVYTYTAVLDRVGGAYSPFNMAVIYYNRGSAHVALNQDEAAIHDLQKTLELNPDHEKAKEKLRNLQQTLPKSDNESQTLDSGNHGNNSQVEQTVSLRTARCAIRSTEAIYYMLGYQPLN